MSEDKLKALQDALALKQKELDLITAIDEIRDTIPEPEAMLAAIVNLLANQLEAELCLLFLLDHETKETKLKAVNDRGRGLDHLQQAITHKLAERATQLDHITTWEGRKELPAESLANLPEDMQLVAVPIILGTARRLGALLLARSRAPFGPNDVQLLKTAEDFIDSAVIQGYVYEGKQQSEQEVGLKRKELEMLVAIDQIRDAVSEPGAMLTAIVNLLADRLEAELCLLFLLDRETGVAELRAVNERSQEFDQLRQAIARELTEWITRLDEIITCGGREELPVESLAKVPEDLQLAAVPIVMGTEERLGTLLLARSGVPFGPDDVQLLKTAEDQIDSAVIQGQIYEKHQLSAKELATIYQVDRIRDQGLSLDEMLNAVLNKLCTAIETEMGFFMR
jgi:GAF domain-containing protein